MTLYVYRCPAGNHDLERFYPLGEAPECVTCADHKTAAWRVPSRGTFLGVPGGHNATYKP